MYMQTLVAPKKTVTNSIIASLQNFNCIPSDGVVSHVVQGKTNNKARLWQIMINDCA